MVSQKSTFQFFYLVFPGDEEITKEGVTMNLNKYGPWTVCDRFAKIFTTFQVLMTFVLFETFLSSLRISLTVERFRIKCTSKGK